MKDLILLFSQILAQHAWIKYALEITLLTLGAGVVRVVTLRLFKRWTMHLNWKYKHFLIALVERMITPILVIALVSAGFNLFPLSGRLLTAMNRTFYVAILAIGIYCAAKAALILLNQWIGSGEGRESFREPAQFVVRVIFGAFGTMTHEDLFSVCFPTKVVFKFAEGHQFKCLWIYSKLPLTLNRWNGGSYTRQGNAESENDAREQQSGGSASILRNTRWLFFSRVLEVSDERSLTRARNRATPANRTASARTSRSLAPSESSVWRTGKANYNINPDVGTGRGRAE